VCYDVSAIPTIGRCGNYVLFLWHNSIIDLIIYAGYEQAHLLKCHVLETLIIIIIIITDKENKCQELANEMCAI